MAVDRLNVINDYNLFMDGVDLQTQLDSIYKFRNHFLRIIKWPHAVFNWFLNVCIVNSYICYKLMFKKYQEERHPLGNKKFLSHLEFRQAIVAELIGAAPSAEAVRKRHKRKIHDEVTTLTRKKVRFAKKDQLPPLNPQRTKGIHVAVDVSGPKDTALFSHARECQSVCYVCHYLSIKQKNPKLARVRPSVLCYQCDLYFCSMFHFNLYHKIDNVFSPAVYPL